MISWHCLIPKKAIRERTIKETALNKFDKKGV
jgi:hypothetical protein